MREEWGFEHFIERPSDNLVLGQKLSNFLNGNKITDFKILESKIHYISIIYRNPLSSNPTK